MKLPLVVAAALVLALSGCARKPRVVPGPATAIPYESAVGTVVGSLSNPNRYPSLPAEASVDVRLSWIDVTLKERSGPTVYRLWLEAPIVQYNFAGLAPKLDVPATWGANKQGTIRVRFDRQQELVAFAQAFNELVAQNAPVPWWWNDFEAKAAAWRAADPKPPLSESGTKSRILAENAVRENDHAAALRHFQAALATDQTWSTGYLNAALILGDMGDFGAAVRYLKCFLLLEPDGRDSAPARQKLVIWEDKATRPPP